MVKGINRLLMVIVGYIIAGGLSPAVSGVEYKMAMVIAQKNFRDEEFTVPKGMFEEFGCKVDVYSSRKGIARGMLGYTVRVRRSIRELDPRQYDAIVLVGGMGASEYWDNRTLHRILQEAVKEGRIIGAICLAPVTLANAGILRGKRATVWPSCGGLLEKRGATYTGAEVEVDGNIVTGNGPQAAQLFGYKILEVLVERSKT